jgi:hypothetical protein
MEILLQLVLAAFHYNILDKLGNDISKEFNGEQLRGACLYILINECLLSNVLAGLLGADC